MKKAITAMLLASTLASPLMAQQWRDVRQDRQEVRDSRGEVQQDRREVRQDLRRGDYGEAQRDSRELREDRRDLRDDRGDLRQSVRDTRGADWRRPDYNDPRWSRQGWSSNWRNNNAYDWRGYRQYNRSVFVAPRYVGPRNWAYRSYRPGARIDRVFYSRNYWISDPWRYRLPYASGAQRWVRYGDDVLLVDIRRGIILDVIESFYWR